MRVLDLFCGRFGWGREFARRGHEVVGVDLVEPPEVPEDCEFVEGNVLHLDVVRTFHGATFYLGDVSIGKFDFVCASSPCEQFSVHGMKHFFPNPPYPTLGIKLFNHTREICERSGLPFVMENVRPAQKFVGNAAHHCGPFYLWGNAVPPIMPQGIKKGMDMGWNPVTRVRSDGQLYRVSNRTCESTRKFSHNSPQRLNERAKIATIPTELASCVADYAERLCEVAA